MSQSVPKSIRVLLIEDNELDALFVDRLLTSCPDDTFSVEHVTRLADAIEKLSTEVYDVALLDLTLTDAVGLESFEKLRALDARLPVVVLTGLDDEQLALTAIESGAQDFIAKEHVSGQMLFRVLRFAIARQLKVMGFQAAADTDPLTELPNRRFLQSNYADIVNAAADSSVPISLAIIDVDHFKSVNDQYGHFVGDAVLKEIACVAKKVFSADTCAARIGGEEFAILMPGHDIDQACERIDAFLKCLETTTMTFDDDLSVTVTASAGVLELSYNDPWDKAYVAADAALYEAKSSGRNRYQRRSRIADASCASSVADKAP